MEKKHEFILLELLLVISILVLFYSGTLFYKGFHNVDLVYNYKDLISGVNEINREWGGNKSIELTPLELVKDRGISNNNLTLSEYYNIGISQMIRAFEYGIFAAFIIGFLIQKRRFYK